MTRSMMFLAAAAAAMLFAPAARPARSSPAHPPAVAAVAIQDYAFKPSTISVAPGTTVAWTNRDDDPHTVTADHGTFDSKGLGQGDVYRHRFDTPGRYAYHCSAHPFMKGFVEVKAGATR